MPFYIYGMALELLYNPGTYFSAHGDLIFTVLEDVKAADPVNYPDYKYVCDVYLGVDLIARLKAVPRPSDNIGIFNVSNIVRNYLDMAFAFSPDSLRAREAGIYEFFITAALHFGEEYGLVTYPDIIEDSERTYFNHYNGRAIGQNTILSSYLDKVMSVRPYATPVYRNAKYCLVPFLATDDTTINVIVKSYNGGGLIATVTQPVLPTADSSNTLQVFNVAPAGINASNPGFINSFVTYYTVEFNTTNIVDDSIYRFNLVCEPKFEVYTLHFLNRFGGVESRDFTKVSRKSVEIEKSDFGKLPYTISAEGIPKYYDYNSNTYNETKRVYASQYKEKMTLNTDILTDDEYTWLGDLMLSPMVYMDIGNYLVPVQITDKNYEFKKNVNDDLTNLTINIEYGDQFNTQYR